MDEQKSTSSEKQVTTAVIVWLEYVLLLSRPYLSITTFAGIRFSPFFFNKFIIGWWDEIL